MSFLRSSRVGSFIVAGSICTGCAGREQLSPGLYIRTVGRRMYILYERTNVQTERRLLPSCTTGTPPRALSYLIPSSHAGPYFGCKRFIDSGPYSGSLCPASRRPLHQSELSRTPASHSMAAHRVRSAEPHSVHDLLQSSLPTSAGCSWHFWFAASGGGVEQSVHGQGSHGWLSGAAQEVQPGAAPEQQ